MADESKRDKRIEEEALQEVARSGVMHDVFLQFEELQFLQGMPDKLKNVQPRQTYAELVWAYPFISSEVKAQILAESDPVKVQEHDWLVEGLNRDLPMIKNMIDFDRLNYYIERSRRLRARPIG